MKGYIMTMKNDMLASKQAKLNLLNLRYDNAVSLVTSTLDSLESINAEIDTNMAEIETYTQQLLATKDELSKTREKNTRVITNFRKLLEA